MADTVVEHMARARSPRAIVRSMVRGVTDLGPVRAIGRYAYGVHFARTRGLTRMFRGIYPDFAAAEASVPAGGRIGFDHDAAAGVHAPERFQIAAYDYPLLFWLARLLPDNPRLFDLGGNVGNLYFAYRRYLSYPPDLDWITHDLPSVVRLGEAIVAQEPSPGLRFTTTLDDVPRADILIAAGALHFLDDPFGMLRRAGPLPRHILINKTPLSDAADAVTLLSVGVTYCPYRLFNRSAFLAAFDAMGYDCVDRWDNPELGCRVPFHPDHTIHAYSGCYLRARAP